MTKELTAALLPWIGLGAIFAGVTLQASVPLALIATGLLVFLDCTIGNIIKQGTSSSDDHSG